MKPAEINNSDAIGWHVIARDGDMTARVHPGMCLGEEPSGELSFESTDAVLELYLVDDGLSLEAASRRFELIEPQGGRVRAIHVLRDTQVELILLDHLLYIGNRFVIANPPGEIIRIAVVPAGESPSGVGLGPMKAGHHDAPMAGRAAVTSASRDLLDRPGSANPADILRREHDVARANKRHTPVAARPNVLRNIRWPVAGAAITVLVIALIFTQVRFGGSGPMEPEEVELSSAPQQPATVLPTVNLQPAPDGPVALNPDVLMRFSVLLDADSLPDKAMIDFTLESLKSLRVAYPDDTGVVDALEKLTQRLVAEARLNYDGGDAFLAGRLIELASTTGVAQDSVGTTMDYFASTPPSRPSSEVVTTETVRADAILTDPTEVVADEGAETDFTVSAADALVSAAIAEERAEAGTDSGDVAPIPDTGAQTSADVVETAVALSVVASAIDASQPELPVGPEALADGPVEETVTGSIDDRMQILLASLLSGVESSSSLPPGAVTDAAVHVFGSARQTDPALETVDDRVQTVLAAILADLETRSAPTDAAAEQQQIENDVSGGPRLYAFSALIPTFMTPLEYPRRSLPGANGTIEIEFTVTEEGSVSALEVKGEAARYFIRAAEQTVRRWTFEPVMEDGKAVPVRTALRVQFRS